MRPLGDPSCEHSANHPALRCAINPSGPCNGCPDYRKASRLTQFRRLFWRLEQVHVLNTLLVAFVGINIGVVLTGFVIIPALNIVIERDHPCWPALGVSRYCSRN